MSQWIKCSDRLPQETEAYGCYTDDVLCCDGREIFVGFLARQSGCPLWYCGDSHRSVTHWMPLPAPPVKP